MSREKQIEEMRNEIHNAEENFCVLCRSRQCRECEYYFAKTDCRNQLFAEHLYNAGYRKASEVAMEIIRDIVEPVWDVYKSSQYEDIKLLVALLCESIKCKLEDKYTEGEGNEGC